MRLSHPFGPLCAPQSHTLILGSFPSVKSREQQFFYGHPQNRFWRVLSALYGEAVPATIEEKKALILSHDLALWDVIARCEITGSSDASIRAAEVNDLSGLLARCPIRRIFCNGRKAHALYRRHIEPVIARPAVCLPSTSPANAQWTMERLLEAWGEIRDGE